MVTRYMILAGIPLSEMTLFTEIKKLTEFLMQSIIDPQYDWNKFLFVTNKIGAEGPSKEECMNLYQRE